MKALCWFDTNEVAVHDVPDPKIINRRDAVVRITTSAICGSDLHLVDGFVPTMEKGDILGHEFMGEIVELGPGVKNLKVGDRVVIPFPIACGGCRNCEREMFSCCENSNPNASVAEKFWGFSCAGIYGYSHMTGGYSGGQAQYARVPYADTNAFKVPNDLTDEQVLFLSDIYPTGYMAAEQCNIKPGDTVAVWGCGPVGLLAMKSAFVLGAGRVIGIDRIPERLQMAREKVGAETLDYTRVEVYEALRELTYGLGPHATIDAVGMESHAVGLPGVYDRLKQALMLETDRAHSLREAILCCRAGGTVSIPGVYGGFVDKVPFGAIVNKALTIRTGQTHVQHYMPHLLQLVQEGTFDPSFVITHRLPLTEAPKGYKIFRDKLDQCIKVVLKPWADAA